MASKKYRVVFSADCDKAAEAIGGYGRIDKSLDASWDGLHTNPHGFPIYESDWFSVRYILTRPMPGIPPLLWTFRIFRDEVELLHVEEFERY
jgi:hypothetical protein